MLEILFALLVGAILMLMSLKQYYRYKQNQQLESLKANIAVLKEVTNLFYYHQCVKSAAPFKNRFESGLFNIEQVRSLFPFQLSPSRLVNSLSSKGSGDRVVFEGYEIYAEPFGSPIYLPKEGDAKVILYPYRLILKVNFSDTLTKEAADVYQTTLGATVIENGAWVWKSLPRQKGGDLPWVVETGLQQFRKKSEGNFSFSREASPEEPLLMCAY